MSTRMHNVLLPQYEGHMHIFHCMCVYNTHNSLTLAYMNCYIILQLCTECETGHFKMNDNFLGSNMWTMGR